MPSAFDDRTVTLGAPQQLAELCAVLGSDSRLAILRVLMDSPEALHINEVARRVKLDASPVRTHLQVLETAGLVRELDEVGRARRFTTSLAGIRLTLEGANRERRAPTGPVPKHVLRLEKKLAGYAKDAAAVEAKARRVQADIAAEWAKGEGRKAKGDAVTSAR